MTAKNITPIDPKTFATATIDGAEDKTAERKTNGKGHPRRSARMTSGIKHP